MTKKGVWDLVLKVIIAVASAIAGGDLVLKVIIAVASAIAGALGANAMNW